jgi:Zn ribbon nucleic-acid-binding protein
MPKKKTNEEFLEEVYNLVKDEYILLEKYINSSTKILFKHNICGNKFLMTPNHFLGGNRCPTCSAKNAGLKIKDNLESFSKKLNEKFPNEYDILSEYITNKTNMTFRHKKCANIFTMKPKQILKDNKFHCPICAKRTLKTTEEFAKEVKEKTNGEYELVSDYINNKTKLNIKHNKCGNIYFVRPDDFVHGHRCPHCKKYIGEETIEKWLIENNINYKHKHKFPDCKYKKPLEFDFYLPDNNMCIEFDGEFHYYEIYYEGSLEVQQIRDSIKNNYCKDKNIKMLRIPYWDFDNISEILQENLFPMV